MNIPAYKLMFDRDIFDKMLGNLSPVEQDGWHRALDHFRDFELFTLELDEGEWRYMPNKRVKNPQQLLGTMALVRQLLEYRLVQVCWVD